MTKMKLLLISLLTIFSFSLWGQSIEDNIVGDWKTKEDKIINIVAKGQGFEGLAASANKLVMENIRFEGDKWKGTMIRPTDGKKANCTLLLQDKGKTLKVTVKKGMMSKNLFWTKQ